MAAVAPTKERPYSQELGDGTFHIPRPYYLAETERQSSSGSPQKSHDDGRAPTTVALENLNQQLSAESTQEKVANYFRFLEQDMLTEADEGRPTSRWASRGGRLAALTALVCILQALVGVLFIAFAAARTASYLQLNLTAVVTGNNSNALRLSTLRTSTGRAGETGLLVVFASILGLISVGRQSLGAKLAHLFFSASAIYSLLQTVSSLSLEAAYPLNFERQIVPLTLAIATTCSIALLLLLSLSVVILTFSFPLKRTILQHNISHFLAPGILLLLSLSLFGLSIFSLINELGSKSPLEEQIFGFLASKTVAGFTLSLCLSALVFLLFAKSNRAVLALCILLLPVVLFLILNTLSASVDVVSIRLRFHSEGARQSFVPVIIAALSAANELCVAIYASVLLHTVFK